jgi:hypothetical protein
MSKPRGPKTYQAWTDAEDRWLLAHARDFPIPMLIAMMATEFEVTRTYESICKRKYDLGVQDADHTWLSSDDIARVLGVGKTFVRSCMQAGLIPWRHSGRFPHGNRAVFPHELDAFVKAEHLRFRPEKMPPSRWRAIVELEYRTHRYLTVPEVARLLGIGNWTDCVRAMLISGEIPAQLLARAGGNGGPRWVVKQADALAYLARRDRRAA